MEILNIQNHKRNYLPLLLLADEQEAMINRYLDRGELFALMDPANHQSLCKRCHDRKTALEQRKTGGFF